ncbi:NDP-hexose 2,3-dehydratase family protein [Photobacterium kishitanii]|uniref:NDP-hexose 2,3-dehydratase family protein n=1 Tax=Photobacterium kishitanii TaxID=318456 RepID=UPI000D16EE61|nr:NDP-hexose 2,3-dehydratase family protein [Photobacterium kishitanii]PSW51288.1 dNDP-4-keto-6-deoxy-glucose-2,3- dehydratase [Photobacterium kishitanii]
MTTIKYDNKRLTELLLRSWSLTDTKLSSLAEHLDWVQRLNDETKVVLKRTSLSECGDWYYDVDVGEVRNSSGTFFKITGIREFLNDKVFIEQPIILQQEIGFIGFLCKEIDGELYFLVQAKIEPGNVNKIQLSPTIQATRSNFEQKHGGRQPQYLEYFAKANDDSVLYDQIQSEQSSRFYGKRNRNIIVMTQEDIQTSDGFRFLTLGQLKALMDVDNLVNMDARTVISCLPYDAQAVSELASIFTDKAFYNSLAHSNKCELKRVIRLLNDKKMYSNRSKALVKLDSLKEWHLDDSEVHGSNKAFKVGFFEIEIEGREVTRWHQPLFEAIGMATLGLFTTVIDEERKFLVKLTEEVGCFDEVELGPTIQIESNHYFDTGNVVESLFERLYKNDKHILHNVILSEEGGRFYHEQNRNVIIDVEAQDLETLDIPDDYIWVSFQTLNQLVKFNNILNLQLRNLLSLLRI